MWHTRRARFAVIIGVAILALASGTAIAADQMRSRDRAHDGTCVSLTTGAERYATGTMLRIQGRNRLGESEEATGAVRTRAEVQERIQTGCASEPACEMGEPLTTQASERDRDRTGENDDAPGAVRTRTEERECNEVCAGEQGSDPPEPEGPYGPGDPARVRSGEPGAGAGGS
jgi:hypothetical protein